VCYFTDNFQCCHSTFLEFPRLCSKNSQVDLKIPKLIKMKNNITISLEQQFTCTYHYSVLDQCCTNQFRIEISSLISSISSLTDQTIWLWCHGQSTESMLVFVSLQLQVFHEISWMYQKARLHLMSKWNLLDICGKLCKKFVVNFESLHFDAELWWTLLKLNMGQKRKVYGLVVL